uniref:cbb3-type cytochrome c oxidase subunit I n=1 Tax=Streptomyces luteolifulvus TaxID=2615112 RepID=UPI001CD9B533
MLVASPKCDVPAGGGHRRGVRDLNLKSIKWLTSTDHKTIGTLYLVTSFAFFCIGGAMALFMRAELARPGLQIMSNEQFNQAFTMHGTIMLLMFATPLF